MSVQVGMQDLRKMMSSSENGVCLVVLIKRQTKETLGMIRKVKTVSLEEPSKEQTALVDASHDQ
jgi:hypothetical protein